MLTQKTAARDLDYLEQDDFAKAVRQALSGRKKRLPSKYLYDDRGSALFVEITKLPEYYLTNCETEIFRTLSPAIIDCLPDSVDEIVELGCGDGQKTEILLNSFARRKPGLKFVPVDIHPASVKKIGTRISSVLSDVEVSGYVGDYFAYLNEKPPIPDHARLFLFLGSNIGNFDPDEAVHFLCKLHDLLDQEDYLLIGMDLKKEVPVMQAAYDDSQGVTTAFNLNLLHRMNRELDADFDPGSFYHHACYNAELGAMQSFLLSRKTQDVHLAALGMTVHFDLLEALHVENSFKYSFQDIHALAQHAGFHVVENFLDSKAYFTDSLWRKKP
ncbi:L-histidine N(alpha)-methyltransferase [Luteithermobacter gelatinilyticus]|uniref:L-histidine N(alpha)-methyltransferase n=1 Tax=Luteithermobacter gelatinilyticus TaxID=2582913 RepID=UPI001105824F|nr:L-histidine N(alpha)-methyltransferase [Luteithermobacter gelatinilyticus]